MLKPFDVEFGPFMAEIDEKEKVIRECADSVTMGRIKSKLIVLVPYLQTIVSELTW